MSDTIKHYLRDLIFLLKEREMEFGEDPTLNDFDLGEKVGLQKTISLIESQADAFGIDMEEIGFYDFEKNRRKLD